jgi:predicted TPR repeat methyltransferase
LLRKGDVDGAGMAFRRSLELVPSADAWANVARVFRRLDDLPVSEEACRQALALEPDHPVATHNLALALLIQRRSEEGVAQALKAMHLLPPRERRRQLYVQLLQVAGEPAQAAVILRAWREQEPNNPYVLHHLAACTGEAVPGRASDAYVETEFDCFAASFDATLERLNYRAPTVVADAVAAALAAPARQFDIADLGCGTGLCGPLVRPWARRLVGCDLSRAMLEQAARREAYDELHQAELVQFLDARPAAFDVLVAADTLIYLGDLAPLARAAAGALRPDGCLVVSIEGLADDHAEGVELLTSGRYAHSPRYLDACFAAAGLVTQSATAVVLREENFEPVHGWIVTAARV